MVHRECKRSRGLGGRRLVRLLVGGVEEGCIPFDLHQAELGYGLDHGLEQPSGDLLGVREAHPVQPHEARVPADVGDQEERLLYGHSGSSLRSAERPA